MAYVLRSDEAISDPNNVYPILTASGLSYQSSAGAEVATSYGYAPHELKTFLDDQATAGNSLTQAEFDALRTFINNLRLANLWGSVRECYPMIGSGVDTAAIKLGEFASSGRTMSRLYINDGNFDIVSGRVIDKAQMAQTLQNAPSFDTGLTVGDFNDNWGVTAYVGSVPSAVKGYGQYLWGCLQDAAGVVTECGFFREDDGNQNIRVRNQTTTPSWINEDQADWSPAVWSFDADGADVKILRDATSMASMTTTNRDATAGQTQTLNLFSRTPVNGNGPGGDTGGIAAPVRFVVQTDGGLTDAQYGSLRTEIETLMTALGRTFA